MEVSLLEKFFSGKASKEEKQKVLDFFKQERLEYSNEKILREWWYQYLEANHDKTAESRVLKNIHQQINRPGLILRKRLRVVKMAAFVLLVISMAFIIFKVSHVQIETPRIATIETIIKETPLGAKLQFMLPDGSRVHLNAGSKITYPSIFSGDERTVNLTGEAYFDVVRDTLKPFIVNCQQVNTKVLGTSFNLSGYDHQKVKVALTSGKVQVDIGEQEPTFLEPGEQLVYDQSQQKVEVEKFDSFLVTGWKDGVLIFYESDLPEIIEKLQHWYDVEIHVEEINQLAQRDWDYSGQFENESLENVLTGIGYIKSFDYEIDGKEVTLKF